MKKRNGFVSNSSSSSFIVKLDKKPNNYQELAEAMFPGKDLDYAISFDLWDRQVYRTVGDICEDVFQNKEDSPASIKSALDGWLPGSPEYDSFRNIDGKVDWQEYIVATEQYKEMYYKKNIHDPDKYIFTVTYSDNDGDVQCLMEHGDIFRNVEHEKISFH